jgi:hypothetical protein
LEVLIGNMKIGTVRREYIGGREYLIAPMTSIVPGVLNGSKGPLFYPPSEIKSSVRDWDNVPLVVYHPSQNGRAVSATAPGVLQKQGIGFLRNSKWKDKLIHEGCFDVESTKRVDPRVLDALLNRRPMELSTGLFTDNEEAENGANYKGRTYSYVARNYRPDHMAILPDQVGACSVNDGCGLLINENSSLEDLVVNLLHHNASPKYSSDLLEEYSTNASPGIGQPRDSSGRFGAHGSGTGKGDAHEAAKSGSDHDGGGKGGFMDPEDDPNAPDPDEDPNIKSKGGKGKGGSGGNKVVGVDDSGKPIMSNSRLKRNEREISVDADDEDEDSGDEKQVKDKERFIDVRPRSLGMGNDTRSNPENNEEVDNDGEQGQTTQQPTPATPYPTTPQSGKQVKSRKAVASGSAEAQQRMESTRATGPTPLKNLRRELNQVLRNAGFASDEQRKAFWGHFSKAEGAPSKGKKLESEGLDLGGHHEEEDEDNRHTPKSVDKVVDAVRQTKGSMRDAINDTMDKMSKKEQDEIHSHFKTHGDRGLLDDRIGADLVKEYFKNNREWSQKKRDNLDDSDFAGPDQSFPITSQADVDAASHLVGHADNLAAVKRKIKAIAKRKGLNVPDSWTENLDGSVGDYEHQASQDAAVATLRTDHPEARGHAMGAVDASADDNSPDAQAGHIAAAKTHDKAAMKARSGGDDEGAEQHENAAMLHRKAAGCHKANCMAQNIDVENYNPTGINQYTKGDHVSGLANKATNQAKKSGAKATAGQHEAAARAHDNARLYHMSKGNDKIAAEHGAKADFHARKADAIKEKSAGPSKREAARKASLRGGTNNEEGEEGILNKKRIIAKLISNRCACESERESLMSLSLASLKKLARNAVPDMDDNGNDDEEDEQPDPDDQDDADDDEGDNRAPVRRNAGEDVHSFDQKSPMKAGVQQAGGSGVKGEYNENRSRAEARWLASAPPRIRETVELAMNHETEYKKSLVWQLVANVLDPSERNRIGNKLMRKSLPEIKELIALLPPTRNNREPEPTYFGAAVPTDNRNDGFDSSDVLLLPVMNYGSDD